MTVIRLAENGDIQKILQLSTQLGYPQNSEDFPRHFEIFNQQEGYGVAVAEHLGFVVGWVAWSKSLVFIMDKVRIHIEGLIVDKKHRGLGIGQMLMKFVEDFAQRFGPYIIDLTSGLRRSKDGTHEFYKALGYRNEGEMAKLYLRKEV